MQMNEFVSLHRTTRDTVRHYIDCGLLTPEKKGSWYHFEEKDSADFQNITELKNLGFSIKGIQTIKARHETNCCTLTQWQENLSLIQQELSDLDKEIENLITRRSNLNQYKTQLQKNIQTHTDS